jgi:Fe-S cluster assembly protein SufB
VSKGISAGKAQNTYRGLVSMHPKAKNSRNYTQCDSLLIGDKCGAHTVPYIEVKNNSSRVEHEATTSKVDDDQLFYCRQRGMDEEEAVALVVNGFCKEVLQALPMEFAMEAQQLVAISLEGSVGSGHSSSDDLDLRASGIPADVLRPLRRWWRISVAHVSAYFDHERRNSDAKLL